MATKGTEIGGNITINTVSINRAIKVVEQFTNKVEEATKAITATSKDTNNSIKQLVDGLGRVENASKGASTGARGLGSGMAGAAGAASKANSTIASNIRTINQAEVSYTKLTARVRDSALEESEKAVELSKLDAAMKRVTKTVNTYGSKSDAAAQDIADFKTQVTQSGLAAAKANRSFRGQEVDGLKTQFRDLTSSAQLALGPLNGIAARLVTLQGIFNRNTGSIAALLVAFTGFTVSIQKGLMTARTAEEDYLRLQASLKGLAATSRVTADEVFSMARRIADATLLSNDQARKAVAALTNYGSYTADQMERIVLTAQGLSEQLGGDLFENTRKLGLVMQNPAARMGELRERVGELDKEVQDQIKTLQSAGKIYEANEVLLGALSDKVGIATASAGGLSGAFDAVSGAIDNWYEDALLFSGATEVAANQVLRFKDTLVELQQSDFGAGMINAYVKSIDMLGNVVNAIARNLDQLAVVMSFLAGVALVRLITMGAKLLTKFLNPGILSFKGLGVAAKGGAKGVAIFTTALSAINPWLLLLRAASAAAAVALGVFLNRAITSGEAQDEAANKTNKHVKSLEDLLEVQKALDEYSTSDSGISAELQGLIDQVDAVSSEMESLDTQIETALGKSIAGGQIKKRLDDVDSGLMNLIRSVADLRAQGVSLDSALSQLEGTSDAYDVTMASGAETTKEVMLEVIRLASSQEMLSSEMMALIMHQEAYIEGLKESQDEERDLVAQHENQILVLQQLGEEFMQVEARRKKLNQSLQNAQTAVKFYEEFASELKNGNERLAEAEALVKAIQKAIEEFESGNIEALGSSFATVEAQMISLRQETESLNAALNGDSVDAAHKIENMFRASKTAIADMNATELTALVSLLDQAGYSVGITNENILESRELISGMYQEYLNGEIRLQTELQKRVDAEKTLADYQKDQRSELQQLAHEYAILNQAALDAGDAQAQGQIQNDRDSKMDALAAEAQAMREFQLSLTREEIDALKEERAARLAEMYGEESSKYKEHLSAMGEASKNAEMFAAFTKGAEGMLSTTESIMGTMETLNRDQGKDYQNFAIAQALISGALAITNIIAASAKNGIASTILNSALVGAQVGAQVAAIKKQSFSTGGFVTGEGTATSDSIPAWLSNGEYVMRASAVRALGVKNLEALNSGQMPEFNAGGMIGTMPIATSGGSNSGVNIQIIDQRSGNSQPVETSQKINPDGTREIKVMIRDIVREEMSDGHLNNAQSSNNKNYKPRPKAR